MKNIETKNITLLEEVETIEAEELLHTQKIKWLWLFIVPLALAVVFLILSLSLRFPQVFSLVIFCVLIAIALANIGVYFKQLAPYIKLKRVAQLNDRIRHEEKIRFKERQRLQQEDYKEKYTKQDITNTIKKLGQ